MHIARCTSLVALLSALGATPSTAQLARLDHPDLAIGRIQTVCRASNQVARGTHLSWQRALFDSAFKPTGRHDPDLLVALGCADAALFVDSPTVMLHGRMSYSSMPAAAVGVFLRALQARPGDTVAAAGLATFAFDVTEHSGIEAFPLVGLTDRIANAAYRAVEAGVETPIVLRLCVEFAIGAGDFATARHCLNRAFSLGVDPSWHLERQALLAFQMNDNLGGVASFDLALALAHDSAALADVGWRAAWLIDTLATPGKKLFGILRTLSDSARVEWLHHQVSEQAATSGDGSPYAERLAHAFLTPAFEGALLQQCPIRIAVNGAEQEGDRSRCMGEMANAVKRVEPTGQLVRLWNPASGEPIAVLGYAIGRQGLVPDTGGRFDARTVSLDLNIRQFEWETGAWRDTVFHERVPLTNDMMHPPLTGVVSLPVYRGTVSWTLGASQPAAFGAVSEEGAHFPIATGHVVLSDVVLGVAEQGASYRLGPDTIVLAPLKVVRRKKPLELYFQLKSDSARDDLKKTITLRRIVGGRIDPVAAITVGDRTPVHPGINPFHRELNISSLIGSDFQMDLQIVNAAGQVVARRWINLLVR